MPRNLICRAASLFVMVVLAGCDAGPVTGDNEVSFAADILPILHSECLGCHSKGSEGYEASGFSVADYESVMAGTKLGPVVRPGNSISSTLYVLILPTADESVHMPRQSASHAAGLTNHLQRDQIELMARWIDEGAKNN